MISFTVLCEFNTIFYIQAFDIIYRILILLYRIEMNSRKRIPDMFYKDNNYI